MTEHYDREDCGTSYENADARDACETCAMQREEAKRTPFDDVIKLLQKAGLP